MKNIRPIQTESSLWKSNPSVENTRDVPVLSEKARALFVGIEQSKQFTAEAVHAAFSKITIKK